MRAQHSDERQLRTGPRGGFQRVAVFVALACGLLAVADWAWAQPRGGAAGDGSNSSPRAPSTGQGKPRDRVKAGAKGESSPPAEPMRLREGMEVHEISGTFQQDAQRVFFNSSQGSFGVLENLNLERVLRVLEDRPGALVWTVTGTVTEFRGANYLLIGRASLKSPDRSGTLH